LRAVVASPVLQVVFSCSGTVSPTITVPRRCRFGTPSRYRIAR
jgi:hypothetical protein